MKYDGQIDILKKQLLEINSYQSISTFDSWLVNTLAIVKEIFGDTSYQSTAFEEARNNYCKGRAKNGYKTEYHSFYRNGTQDLIVGMIRLLEIRNKADLKIKEINGVVSINNQIKILESYSYELKKRKKDFNFLLLVGKCFYPCYGYFWA